MPFDIELEEWHEERVRKKLEEQEEFEDLDYQIENPDEYGIEIR